MRFRTNTVGDSPNEHGRGYRVALDADTAVSSPSPFAETAFPVDADVSATMARFLLATSSVHVTAAAADYLDERLDPAADEVVVVAVREPDAPDRDAGEAANVARSRLAAAAPTVDVREGDPLEELLAAVDESDPDEVVVGTHRGEEGASGLGSTAALLLERLDRPAVVVPLSDR